METAADTLAALLPLIRDLAAQIRLSQWAAAYLVLIFPVAVSFFWDLQLHREMIAVSLRATAQLILISLILLPVFHSHWTVQAGLILAMLFLGALIARERGRRIPRALPIAAVSLGLSYGPVIALFLLIGALDLLPNLVIPISGMLIGNAVRTVGLTYHRAFGDFESHQPMLEAMMLDGASYPEALRIPAQATLKTALLPRLDALKTLGIVHIPGAMAGMMMAGAAPLEAAGYQLMIFFGIVAVSALSSITANTLAYRRLFSAASPHLQL